MSPGTAGLGALFLMNVHEQADAGIARASTAARDTLIQDYVTEIRKVGKSRARWAFLNSEQCHAARGISTS